MYKIGIAALTGALVSGCITLGDTSITRLDNTSYYSKSTMAYATKDGLLNTEVHGAPFDGISAETIASKLKMPGQYSPAQFTSKVPADRKMNSHRAVLAFNTPANIRGDDLCTTPSNAGSTTGNSPMKAQIAFCVGDEAFAEGQIVAQNVTSADDPAFAKALNSLVHAVLGQRDESKRNRDKPEFVPPG